MSSNYVGLRKSLESTTSVAKQAIDVQAKAAADSKADLEAEHNKHEHRAQELADQGRPAPDRQRQEDHPDRQPRDPDPPAEGRERPQARAGQRDHPRAARPARQERERPRQARRLHHLRRSRPPRGPGQHQPPPGCSPADEDDDLRRQLAGHPHREAQGEHRAASRSATSTASAGSIKIVRHDRPDPGRRHRLLAGLVARRADAVRPDRQDRRQPRRQGRSRRTSSG